MLCTCNASHMHAYTYFLTQVDLFRVTIGGRHTFGCVNMRDFLTALAKAVKPNSTAWDNFQRMYVPTAEVSKSEPDSPLRTNILFKHIQVRFELLMRF